MALIVAVNKGLQNQSTVIEDATPIKAQSVNEQGVRQSPSVQYSDVTQAAGISHSHFNGAYGERLLPETMGGGVAVLAHPLQYKMTATRLRALLDDFKSAGGLALELVSGQQANGRTQYLLQLCQRYELYASCGSDFHRPGHSWSELGVGQLPAQCRPVWTLWDNQHSEATSPP